METGISFETFSFAFAVLSLVFCIIFCCFRASKASVVTLALKTTSSIFFILCAVFAIYQTGASMFGLMILVGLVFGLIGDIILDIKVMYPEQGNEYFIFGTCSFMIGHFFYFASALIYNIDVLPNNILWNILASLGAAIVVTAIILLSSKKMGMNFGKMKWLVAIYSVVLTFMTAFSISIAIFSPIFWIFAVGMIVFLLSDLVLSMQYFGGRAEKVWIYVNHILYYLAQILLAVSILFLVG